MLSQAIRFEKWEVMAVYRYIEWDFGGGVIDNLNISGPMIGVKFFF